MQEGTQALETARIRGAEYVEVRFEDEAAQRIDVRNGEIETLADTCNSGYGVRALYEGAWGFASSADLTKAGIEATAARAVELARASARVSRRPLAQKPSRAIIDTFTTPFTRDPQTVGLDERVRLLLEAEQSLHTTSKVRVGRAFIDTRAIEKHFLIPMVQRSRNVFFRPAAACMR